MSFKTVRGIVASRLDEADRGDRGWWLITRVHLAASWIRAIAQYLHTKRGQNRITLVREDYRAMASIVGISNQNPGQELRRHHLLAMYRPLRLIERLEPSRWRVIKLTGFGRDLATCSSPAPLLEGILEGMRFAVEPWATRGRAQEYADFDVPVHRVTHAVLKRVGGYIDRDEFDFFVSRIRSEQEVDWACNGIQAYRGLHVPEKHLLRDEVRRRIPSDATGKKYSNWRDVGLHTFSLFGLGTSMLRDGTRLVLVKEWTEGTPPVATTEGRHATKRAPPRLRIPSPPEVKNLLTPPVVAAANDGSDGENLVAKTLQSQGWQVAFYTSRRGYGFDLWACKSNRAMLVEVKSSTGRLSTVTLTNLEYKAAKKHKRNYVLALLEHVGSDEPCIRMVADPVNRMKVVRKKATQFTIARNEWVQASASPSG